jgi:hypothetical protein
VPVGVKNIRYKKYKRTIPVAIAKNIISLKEEKLSILSTNKHIISW